MDQGVIVSMKKKTYRTNLLQKKKSKMVMIFKTLGEIIRFLTAFMT